MKVASQSRGSVTLASNSASTLPVIDPGFLTSPTDQTVAIEVFRKIRRIFNTTSFMSVRDNHEEFFPGRSIHMSNQFSFVLMFSMMEGYDQSTDAQLLNVIQNSLQSVWHASCTCAMQPQSNNGVLDPYLRV
jgi:choline dehydrogenase